MDLSLSLTLVALTLSGGGLVVAVILDRRPYRPGKHNVIPAMILCLIACLVLLRHLMTLLAQ